MFARTSRVAVVAKRCMSTSPRMTIAQNIVGISEIIKATNEAGIATAKSVKAIDMSKLPASLIGFEAYLASASASGEKGASVKDPTAWQNFKPLDFVVAEASREDTWPFMVGIL
jgi:hypothetical protein